MTLVADVMFFKSLPFLVTSSRGISLVTIEYLPSRTANRLIHTLDRATQIYRKAGFRVQTVLMDIEFKKLKDRMPYVVLNTTAAREHVGEIEQKIRVVKVRARGKIRESQTALESNTLKSVEISWISSNYIRM